MAWVPWVAWVVWVQWVELWQLWAAKVGAGMVEKEPCQPCGTGAAKAGAAMAGAKGWAKAMALLRQHLLRLDRTRQVAAPKVAGEVSIGEAAKKIREMSENAAADPGRSICRS